MIKINQEINDLRVAHPQSGSSPPDSWSNWNLEMLVFEFLPHD